MPRRMKSYIAGERGANRVRLFMHRSQRLMVEWRENGRKCRRSLGHADWGPGKIVADELAAELRQPARGHQLTLKELVRLYLAERTPRKAASGQRHDKLASGLFLRIIGADREVTTLTARDVVRYIGERKRLGNLRSKQPKAIGAGTLAQEVHLLKAMLSFACAEGYLQTHPLQHVRVEGEANPVRAVYTGEEYQKLLGVANQVSPVFRRMLVTANGTGRRIGAILALTWADVEFESDRIRWRAESDKTGRETVTVMPSEVREVLAEERGIGEARVFEGCGGFPTAQCWLAKAERLAGVPRVKQRGWHSLRRKMASELRGVPTRDLQDLLGWRTARMALQYQQPSLESQRAALAQRQTLQA